MWYVIQVKSGEEERMKELLDKLRVDGAYGECFVPLFEDVKRNGGKCRIGFRKLFPGYLFIESDDPDRIFQTLKRIPDFTKLLGSVENDGTKLFVPIGKRDEEFLRTLFSDGLMHVSYVHMAKNGRIDRVVGPLYNYRNHITKLELRHRMAVVEADMFGKRRKVKFGLWTDDDPVLPLLERLKEAESTDDSSDGGDVLDGIAINDIGIRPGDKVRDDTGVYGDQIFIVERVDANRRTLISTFEMFGTNARIELRVDDVRKI
jgi:transcription antitermination factor NusG